MARARQRRQRGTNYTGILRSGTQRPTENTAQAAERGFSFSWRWLSGALVLGLSSLLVFFFATDALYVSRIGVSGLEYMNQQEVYDYAAINNLHIFWLEPGAVRENLMRFPTVADAQVRVGWPPMMVNVIVEERQPALIWEQGARAMWVDINGTVMPLRAERDDLVRVVAEETVPEDFVAEAALDPAIVYGVLQLHDLQPTLQRWRYDATNGLGYENEAGWNVWFGTGTGMPEKWQIYNTIAASAQARGIAVQDLNVADPDAPYYTVEQ